MCDTDGNPIGNNQGTCCSDENECNSRAYSSTIGALNCYTKVFGTPRWIKCYRAKYCFVILFKQLSN
jgi:hypothetical protein